MIAEHSENFLAANEPGSGDQPKMKLLKQSQQSWNAPPS